MQHRSLLKSLILCVAGAAALLCHDAIGAAFFDGYKLGIGSPLPQEERTRFTFFYAYWVVLGTGALVLLTSGLNRLGYRVDLWTRLAEWWREVSERRWIAVVSILVLLFAILIRSQVLQGVPLTDDEEAYRFSAQVLASGHLTAQSLPEPLKLFFDRNQIINGGRWYSQYFLGWPALMVPGVWLGLTEWVNAFYAALTVFPLYQLVREYVGPNWAKAAVLLFAASPFLMVGAATLGSHTSCMMAATWATYFFSRASEVESPWWWHALFGGAFSVTFFIRPFTAVALGLPFLGLWAWRMVRGDSGVRWRAIAAFAIPAVAMAALFLTVNYLQNGGIFETAYGEYLRYAQGNDYRFSFFTTEDERVVPNLRFEDPLERLAIVGIGVFRLNSALFGWPASLVLLLVAPLRRRLGVWWASVGSYLAFHLLAHDPGIDTYGPVHYFELALPVLILSMAGLERLTRMGQILDEARQELEHERSYRWRRWPALALSVAVVLSFYSYWPVRVGTVARVATNIDLPQRAVETVNLEDAVIFSPQRFVPPCLIEPAHHGKGSRPPNSPSLRDAILWVNHVTVEDDRRLMRYFPERTGYILFWNRDECQPKLAPLERVDPEIVPDALEASKSDLDWSNAPDSSTLDPYEDRF